MRAQSTFSLSFWVNTSRVKNNQAPIYLRVTVNGKRVNISLKTKIPLSNWDSKLSKAKGKSLQSKKVNQYLEQTRAKVYEAYQELLRENKLITAQMIKARFLKEDEIHKNMQQLFEYHNSTMEHKLHKDTMKHYRTTQKYLKSYILKKYKTPDIYLNTLNYDFIIGFENHLKTHIPTDHQRKISNNTAMKHLQRLRKMVTMAFHLEWIAKDPFVRFKSSFEKKEREFLTIKELERIENLNTTVERLNTVKNLFIFSCYTGISFIDMNNLTKNNIVKGIDGSDWIITKRQKTNTAVRIPLLQKAKELIEYYKTNPRVLASESLLPKLSNQRVNSYLKEIADLCKINKNLTFHMARHTFATTITLSNGVPIETVSKILGHKKIATTQIYARVIEKKVGFDMQALEQKLSSRNNKQEEIS